MRKASFLLLLIACLLAANYSATACTCAETDAPGAFGRADAVFIGEVRETGGWLNPFIVLKVEKSWKLVDRDEVTLNVSTDCGGIDFNKGERYLVYSYEHDGDFYTHVCSRTSSITSAEKDLSFLESKDSIPLRKELFTRNIRIGLITSFIVLISLGIGLMLMKFRKSR